jgi:hypothetical protein
VSNVLQSNEAFGCSGLSVKFYNFMFLNLKL